MAAAEDVELVAEDLHRVITGRVAGIWPTADNAGGDICRVRRVGRDERAPRLGLKVEDVDGWPAGEEERGIIMDNYIQAEENAGLGDGDGVVWELVPCIQFGEIQGPEITIIRSFFRFSASGDIQLA